MSIIVESYNPDWVKWYEDIKSRVWPNVSSDAIAIEHVGSTSVKGLVAKPIIDIDIIAKDQKRISSCINSLEKLGYKHRGNLGVEGREAFYNPEKVSHDHHLYVCLEGCDSLLNHLTLRDHLIRNSDDVSKYSKLKMDLAQKYSHDIDAYIEGKTSFIIDVLSQYSFEKDSLIQINSVNQKK
jgi:GrpB-like predicted nucleotidyltransferase (UPF0157 family)